MFYLVRTPWWLRRCFPGCIWEIAEQRPIVYLTFDDGPDPGVTPFVLDQLAHYDMHATFFCIGKNVEAHPEVYARILSEGHRTGNHTHHHLNGWKTDDDTYLADISRAARLVDSDLFRPPYGRIGSGQLRRLRHLSPVMRPVMWSVLSGDFDPGISPARCIRNVLDHARPGSVITFHDSEKAFPVLREALPVILEDFRRKGWEGKGIS
ncbi:MAG: polysaccharide deacetylase family protein [Chitinophagaceae bacterium]|jgi:peptidoglycan/xylan/chitin deacetylase (PgdA/CDA1 family)|nr:polysaccharide deacetylase family protein [Chitinophagaceae bacterium]